MNNLPQHLPANAADEPLLPVLRMTALLVKRGRWNATEGDRIVHLVLIWARTALVTGRR